MLFTLFCNIFANLFKNPNPSFLKGTGKKNAQIYRKTMQQMDWEKNTNEKGGRKINHEADRRK